MAVCVMTAITKGQMNTW